MVDERVRAADVLGHDVRPDVLIAHRLQAFQIVSIAGRPGVGVVDLSFGLVTGPVVGPGADGGPRHVHRWRRRPSACGPGRYLGRIEHQRSAPHVKCRLRIAGGATS